MTFCYCCRETETPCSCVFSTCDGTCYSMGFWKNGREGTLFGRIILAWRKLTWRVPRSD